MGRPAPIPRRSSHLGSAACYGRSAHGSHSSTSAASSRSKRRQGNHNRFQTLKMFPDGHLEKEGDGMRSFVGILLHVLLSNDMISLVDAPEAFLHPPQARLIG